MNSTGRRRGRLLLAGAALSAASFINVAPQPAAALGACPAGANLVINPTVAQAIDPEMTVNSVIVPASTQPRPYDTIASASFYRHVGIPVGGQWGGGATSFFLKVCIQTLGVQPAWPATPSGDTGTQFEACGAPVQEHGYITQDVVIIGHEPDGTPIFHGPFSPEEGWTACTLVSFGVAQTGSGPIDEGFLWQDPTGDSTFLDATSNGLVIPAASWIGNTVTMWIPEVVTWTLPPNGAQPAVVVNEEVLHNDDVTMARDLTVESFASTAAGSPVPVCPSPLTGSGTGGNGSGECLQNAGAVGLPVHWAPGGELGIPAFHQAGIDLGLSPGLPPGHSNGDKADLGAGPGVGDLHLGLGSAPTANALPTCPDIDNVPLSDDPGDFEEVPVGYPPLSAYPPGTTVQTPLAGTPAGANCAIIVGNTVDSGTNPPTVHHFEYFSFNTSIGTGGGRITGHDLPCIPAGTFPGQSACDHLTAVYDFTGNSI